MIILQVFLSFIWMCVLPFLTGCLLLPVFGEEKAGVRTFSFAAGLMLHYSVYEVLLLAGMKLHFGMRLVTALYAAFALLTAAAGLFVLLKKEKKLLTIKLPGLLEKPLFWIGIALILLQIGAVLLLSTPDLDDAFYSGLSSMSMARDQLLRYDAYSGMMTKQISKRYVLSALPVYQASLSLLSLRLHHLFIQHNLFPAFYIPLGYSLFYQVGIRLAGAEEKGDERVLLYLALLHLFGNYYVFSPENFLVTRLWQGKALFVALGIPFLFLSGRIAFRLTAEKSAVLLRVCGWMLTACVMLACTFMGETGLYLAPFMLMTLVAGSCVAGRRIRPLIPAFLTCLPEAALLLYLMIRM